MSVSAVITRRNVIKLLLMSIDSLDVAFPVKPWRSLPARSTNYKVETIVFSGCFESTHSKVSFSIECDRELALFILWELTILFLMPKWYRARMSSAERHSNVYRFSTVKMSFISFNLRPGPSVTILFK